MYLIDTNILITAKNLYYPFDFCSGFWDFTQNKLQSNNIGIIHSVRDEILARDDEIRDWVSRFNISILDDATPDIQEKFRTIVNDITSDRISPNFSRANKERFFSGADPLLISTAWHFGYTVVTNEQAVPLNSSKVKIPNICNYYGVACITPFEMLRRLGINLCHQ